MVGGRGYGQQDLLTKGLFSRVKQFGQEVQEREGEFKMRKKKKLVQKKEIHYLQAQIKASARDEMFCQEVSSATDVNQEKGLSEAAAEGATLHWLQPPPWSPWSLSSSQCLRVSQYNGSIAKSLQPPAP